MLPPFLTSSNFNYKVGNFTWFFYIIFNFRVMTCKKTQPLPHQVFKLGNKSATQLKLPCPETSKNNHSV